MIIKCSSCSRKFIIKDSDITSTGRMVQCGYCSVTWHQMPISTPIKTTKQKSINIPVKEINEGLSVEKIKASDGKTYRFLGSQWAELLPSDAFILSTESPSSISFAGLLMLFCFVVLIGVEIGI